MTKRIKQLTPKNLKGPTKPKKVHSSLVREMRKSANQRALNQREFKPSKPRGVLAPKVRVEPRKVSLWESGVDAQVASDPNEYPKIDLLAYINEPSPPLVIPTREAKPKTRIDSRDARAKIKAKMAKLHSEKLVDD